MSPSPVPDVALTDDETKALGDAWAPVVGPLMVEHGDKAPLGLALVVTAGICYRPVTAYLDAKRATPTLPATDQRTGKEIDAPLPVDRG